MKNDVQLAVRFAAPMPESKGCGIVALERLPLSASGGVERPFCRLCKPGLVECLLLAANGKASGSSDETLRSMTSASGTLGRTGCPSFRRSRVEDAEAVVVRRHDSSNNNSSAWDANESFCVLGIQGRAREMIEERRPRACVLLLWKRGSRNGGLIWDKDV